MFYRKLNEPTVRQSVAISQSTLIGIQRIHKAFCTRWPKKKYPPLSAILDQVLAGRVEAYEADPAQLEEDILDFERRYGHRRGERRQS